MGSIDAKMHQQKLELHRKKLRRRTKGTTSAKSYCLRTIRRHGQHIDSEELSTFDNDVANSVLPMSSSTSTFDNDNALLVEPPFVMHKVRRKNLIIIYIFFLLLLFCYQNRIQFKFIQILKIININLIKYQIKFILKFIQIYKKYTFLVQILHE